MTYIRPLFAGLTIICLGALTSCSSDLTATNSPVKSSSDKFLPHPASAATISKSQNLAKDKHGMPTYVKHSDRTRYVRMTAYSCMENEPGAHGRKNAAGTLLKYGTTRSAAADWALYPLGTTFKIKGLPHTYVVDDYGSALVGTNTIDIYKPNLSKMNKWGTRKAEITIIQWGSYQRSLALLKGRTRYQHCHSMYVRCKHKMRNKFAIRELEKHGAL